MYDCDHPNNSYVAQQSGFEDRALVAYSQHYAPQNLLQQALKTKANGIGYKDTALVSETVQRKSSFFNDWLVPNEIRASAGMKIDRLGSGVISLVLLSNKANDNCRTLMSRKLTRIAPHIQRAYAFYRRKNESDLIHSPYLKLIKTFDTGLLLIKADRKIRYMSDAVRQLLDGQHASLGFNNSRLHVQDTELSALICEMTKANYAGPKTLDYYLPELKLSLMRPEQSSMDTLFSGSSLIILLSGVSRQPPKFDRKLVANTYGLTAAEMRAIEGLISGKAAAEIAKDAGLSRETIRAQIRSLYAKTGAHSQADIIRLVRPR